MREDASNANFSSNSGSSHPRHEHVVVHSVEEFFEIQIDHPAMTRRDVLAGA